MVLKSFWSRFLRDVLSNVIATGIVAFTAVVLIDRFYATPSLDGFWTLTTNVKKSSYKRYEGLELNYLVTLIQNQLNISGNGEKFSEKTKTTANTVFPTGKNRTPIKISGYIEKKIFEKNKLHISIEEFGLRRKSTSYLVFDIFDDDRLVGTFNSTIAESAGTATLLRGFIQKPENK